MTQHTISIPVDNLDDLSARFTKLARRAKKLGLAAPTYTVGKTYTKEVYVDLRKVRIPHTDVVVEGPTLKVSGDWELCATIDHTPSGNVINVVPGTTHTDIPSAYRMANADCVHCGHNRQRNTTYILVDGEGVPHQVGTTCVGDYIGYNPERAALLASYIDAWGRTVTDEWGGMPREILSADLCDYLAHVAMHVRQSGWLSRSAARNGSGNATANMAWATYIDLLRGKRGAEKPTDEDVMRATTTLSYACAHLEKATDVSDYEHNLRVICRENTVTYKTAGYAGSILVYADRLRERATKRREFRKIGENSQHVGEVGKKHTFGEVVLNKCREYDGYYGVRTMMHFTDKSGNVIIWWKSGTTDAEVGNTFTMSAKVKKHDTYRDTAQTVVTRATLK